MKNTRKSYPKPDRTREERAVRIPYIPQVTRFTGMKNIALDGVVLAFLNPYKSVVENSTFLILADKPVKFTAVLEDIKGQKQTLENIEISLGYTKGISGLNIPRDCRVTLEAEGVGIIWYDLRIREL